MPTRYLPTPVRRRLGLPSLSDIQAEFASALHEPAGNAPIRLEGPGGRSAARRFAVYRNNVIVGLTGAVADSFPAVRRIVGDDFFMAMARAYVLASPPSSAVLMHYGGDFANFVAAFEPARSLPYLADVARIERAWREAYHSAEATSLKPADFAGLAETDLPAVVLVLHPSLRLVRSQYPACTIWRMNTGHQPLAEVDVAQGGEDTLVVRPAAEVEHRILPPGGADFVEALASGQTLHAAAELATVAASGFDLSGNIAGLIDSGGVVGYSVRR